MLPLDSVWQIAIPTRSDNSPPENRTGRQRFALATRSICFQPWKTRIDKPLAGLCNCWYISAELHWCSFFTTASAESDGNDSSGKYDCALHSHSP
jgi:hypothetical protein